MEHLKQQIAEYESLLRWVETNETPFVNYMWLITEIERRKTLLAMVEGETRRQQRKEMMCN